MTAFRTRSAIAVYSLMGSAFSISLAGYVWAQQPAENWPFEEHNQAPAAAPQPAPQSVPKSPVQLRLEELYRRDHRPLPDYMRQDGSSDEAGPAQSGGNSSAGEAGSIRTQREAPAAAQGTTRQQLSDYYQSQGHSMPVPQRAGGSSTQNSPSQSGSSQSRASSATQQPAPGHWYDRINPFHKSAPPAQPQSQAPSRANVTAAANGANNSAPAPHAPAAQAAAPQATASAASAPAGVARVTSPTAPVHGSTVGVTVHVSTNGAAPAVAASQSAAESDIPAPVAKSGSFWGDMTLRRVPSQPAARPLPTTIVVELGPSARLVRKSHAPVPADAVVAAPLVVVHAAPSKVNHAVVSPDTTGSTVEPAAPPAPKVAAANAVADDPAMPFLASSEAEADQQTTSGPYTGLTLEDEQSQLKAPALDTPYNVATGAGKPASSSVATEAHHADSAKSGSPASQQKNAHAADSHEVADQHGAGKPSHADPAHAGESHSVAGNGDGKASPAPHHHASEQESDPAGHVTFSDAQRADEHPAKSDEHEAAPQQHVAQHSADQHLADQHAADQHAASEQHATSDHAAESARPHHAQSAKEKARLVAERAGQRGLKGFCPVVLRDQRELADVSAAYCSIYRGRKYYLSSAAAQARFEANPHKYVPVAGGVDVVVKTNSDQDVEGSLDFALWYKDRLYLFCSPESLQAFSLSPTAYSAAAQRID